MKNKITELEISNFKSIKNIKIDCKRINVFIGKPNVGKSNVLEALSLLCNPLISYERFFGDFIRYENLKDLFYDHDRKKQILVESNIGFAALRFHMNQINSYDFITTNSKEALSEWIKLAGKDNSLNEIKDELINLHTKNKEIRSLYSIINDSNNKPTNLHADNEVIYTPVKKYQFKPLKKYHNHFPLFLSVPYGDNLFTMLESNSHLWDECAEYFDQYGLDLLIDPENDTIEVQKKVGRRITKIPYSLAADTLQRFIFHLAAIESNKNSILLFEEPESHSYPPYISLLGDKIVEDVSNQYFIATHSPYLLTPFIEQCPTEDLAIFVCSYENYETKMHRLNDEEIQNILETGIDLFFNLRAFQG